MVRIRTLGLTSVRIRLRIGMSVRSMVRVGGPYRKQQEEWVRVARTVYTSLYWSI